MRSGLRRGSAGRGLEGRAGWAGSGGAGGAAGRCMPGGQGRLRRAGAGRELDSGVPGPGVTPDCGRGSWRWP